MEFWLSFLPLIIYILLIILLIVSIMFGLKAISTITKVEKVIDDVNAKIESINPIFNMIDFMSDRAAGISDKLLEIITGFLGRLITRKDNKSEFNDSK